MALMIAQTFWLSQEQDAVAVLERFTAGLIQIRSASHEPVVQILAAM
jgi:hypothetical protein